MRQQLLARKKRSICIRRWTEDYLTLLNRQTLPGQNDKRKESWIKFLRPFTTIPIRERVNSYLGNHRGRIDPTAQQTSINTGAGRHVGKHVVPVGRALAILWGGGASAIVLNKGLKLSDFKSSA